MKSNATVINPKSYTPSLPQWLSPRKPRRRVCNVTLRILPSQCTTRGRIPIVTLLGFIPLSLLIRDGAVAQHFVNGECFVTLFFFYHAILCVSTVVRCPSVRLSRWIQMAEDIIELLSRPGSTIILVFLTPSADTQFQGELSEQERKIHWGGNFFAIFD